MREGLDTRDLFYYSESGTGSSDTHSIGPQMADDVLTSDVFQDREMRRW